jgi:hypothetical protein
MEAERPRPRKALFRKLTVPFALAATLCLMYAVLLGSPGLNAPMVICSSKFIFEVSQGAILALTNNSTRSAAVLIDLINGSDQVTSSGTYTIPAAGNLLVPAPLPTAPTNIAGPFGFNYITFGDQSFQVTVPDVSTSNGPCQANITAGVAFGSTTPATPTGTSGVFTVQSYDYMTSGTWGWGARNGRSKVSTPACAATAETPPDTSEFKNLVWAPGQNLIFKTTNLSNFTASAAFTLSGSNGTISSSTNSIGPGMTFDWIPMNPTTPSTITIGGKTLTLYGPYTAMVTASPVAGSSGTTCYPKFQTDAVLVNATPSPSSSLNFNISAVLKYKTHNFGEKSRYHFDYCAGFSGH